jgi:folate-binding protein YgfZ
VPDAPSDLRSTGGAVPIRRDVVLVSGPEAIGFLQGQLSQDIEALAVGATARALLLQPTGKVDAWLRATRLEDDTVLLDVDEGAGEQVLARLRRFKLRTKVDLEHALWSGVAIRGAADGAAVGDGPEVHVLPADWPGVVGSDVLAPSGASAGLPLVGPDALEALRVEAGVPAMGAEITPDTIPAELGQWLIDASVSFTKGCYTGQELVARIDSRGGNVPRPLRGLRVDGGVPPVGAEVVVDGRTVGLVTSSATSVALGSIALAPIARSVEIGATVAIGEGGGPAVVAELPLL